MGRSQRRRAIASPPSYHDAPPHEYRAGASAFRLRSPEHAMARPGRDRLALGVGGRGGRGLRRPGAASAGARRIRRDRERRRAVSASRVVVLVIRRVGRVRRLPRRLRNTDDRESADQCDPVEARRRPAGRGPGAVLRGGRQRLPARAGRAPPALRVRLCREAARLARAAAGPRLPRLSRRIRARHSAPGVSVGHPRAGGVDVLDMPRGADMGRARAADVRRRVGRPEPLDRLRRVRRGHRCGRPRSARDRRRDCHGDAGALPSGHERRDRDVHSIRPPGLSIRPSRRDGPMGAAAPVDVRRAGDVARGCDRARVAVSGARRPLGLGFSARVHQDPERLRRHGQALDAHRRQLRVVDPRRRRALRRFSDGFSPGARRQPGARRRRAGAARTGRRVPRGDRAPGVSRPDRRRSVRARARHLRRPLPVVPRRPDCGRGLRVPQPTHRRRQRGDRSGAGHRARRRRGRALQRDRRRPVHAGRADGRVHASLASRRVGAGAVFPQRIGADAVGGAHAGRPPRALLGRRSRPRFCARSASRSTRTASTRRATNRGASPRCATRRPPDSRTTVTNSVRRI